jgi:ribulose-5-phosphate 4-epimerase/fuculose-1-phosphate aldolase
MAPTPVTSAAKIDPDFAAAERTARRDLAAAFRLAAHYGWDDHVATHMSARLPDSSFLLNPFGLLFEEITASSLMRMDLHGNVLDIPPGMALNPAAFGVHSAVLGGREDAMCAIHLHTRDGVAVSALAEGLLPLSQNALTIWGDLAYHDYEGVVSPDQERERIQRDLGDKHLMILRNYGTLALGRSVGAAFYRIQSLEWACAAQVRTLAMGREIALPRADVIEGMGMVDSSDWIEGLATDTFWPAMLRKADRLFPDYAD